MIATTPMVFSSHLAAACGPVRCSRPGAIGTIRGSTCQYLQNFSQHTCTLAPMTRFGFEVSGPLLPGLPNGFCWDREKSGLVGIGEVEVFHPLTFRTWGGGVFFGFLGRRHCFGAHRTLAHSQVAIAEANCHGSIQPDFDPHLSSAQAGTNIRAGDPVDLVVELDRVPIADLNEA